MKLEEKLVSLRKEKGLSQLKLAEMMDVSRQAVSKWEVGSAVPSTDNLKYLGQLYGVSMEYLLHVDALEPNADPADKGTKEIRKSKNSKKRTRKSILIFVLVGVLAAFLCIILLRDRGKDPVSMDDIEGSVMEPTVNFLLKW